MARKLKSDKVLFLATLLLVCSSVVMVYSASAVLAMNRFNQPYFFLIKQAMWAALSASGLPAHSYELNHAMLVALENPDAESRWLKGEDVFAQVSSDRLLEGDDKARRRHLIDVLVAGATAKDFPPNP